MGPAGVSAALAPARRPHPVERLFDGQPRAIVFDSGKCIGCRQCVEACKDWNDLSRGNQFSINASTWLTMEPPVMEGASSVWGRNSCMHCEYPACAAVCPVEAITKYEEGPVVIDQGLCIGCEYCIYACPWHVIARDPTTGKAAKCTMCADRLPGGEAPFCVRACPVDALSFGLVPDLEPKVRQAAIELGGTTYGQREAGGTHVYHVLTNRPVDHGLPNVSTTPYPEHNIPWRKELLGVFTLTGGLPGKLRAVTNAVIKPWRLDYRYGGLLRPLRRRGARP